MSRMEDILEIVEDQATSDLRTCMPAVVESYDHDDQRAAVNPVVDAAFIDPETDEIERKQMPVIPNVPVAFPSAGDVQMTWPINEGDTVLVLWSERSLDEWLTTGARRTQPADNRRHDISDAIAIPALRSFADAVGATDDDAFVVNVEGSTEVHLGKPDPAQYVARAQDVLDELDDIKTRLNAIIDVYEDARGKSDENKKDPKPMKVDDGNDPSLSSYSSNSVAASKTKAE